MNKQEIIQGLKAAAKYFSAMGGGAAFVVNIVGYAVAVPAAVSIPIIAVVGIASAYVGWRREILNMQEEALRATAMELDRERGKQEQQEALGIIRTLESQLKNIAKTEGKIAKRIERSVADQRLMFQQHQEQQRSVSQPLAVRHLLSPRSSNGDEKYSPTPSSSFPSTVNIKIIHSPHNFWRSGEPVTAPDPAAVLPTQHLQEARAHSSGPGL